jgi:hypothetical protein
VFIGLQGCFFYYYVIGNKKRPKTSHECFIFAEVMTSEKVEFKTRVTEDFYNQIARAALRKGLTVPAFTRYVLKKYFNDNAKKQTNSNP